MKTRNNLDKFNKELCKILGLENQKVIDITLYISATNYPTAKITILLEDGYQEKIIKLIKDTNEE